MLTFGIELRGIRILISENVARKFDRRDLHAEADPEIRDILFPRVLRRQNHALYPAVSEPARNDDSVYPAKFLRNILLRQKFRVHPLDVYLRVVLVTAVRECFRNRQIGVVQLHVLPAKRDLYRLAAGVHSVQHLRPFRHVDFLRVKIQNLTYHRGKIALFQHERRFIQHGNRQIFNAAFRLYIAEHRDFILDILGHGLIHARHDDVGRDPHALQLLHGMLRGLGFEFVRTRNIRHQGDVNETAVLPSHFPRYLTDRLDERLAFDVARRPADFRDDHVRVRRLSDVVNKRLYLVGYMRNYLHRLAEIFPAALFVQDVPIHLPRR